MRIAFEIAGAETNFHEFEVPVFNSLNGLRHFAEK